MHEMTVISVERERERKKERELCLYFFFFFFTMHNLLFDNTHVQPLIHISLQFIIERSR